MSNLKTKSRVGTDLTQGSILRTLTTFALPMILTQLIQQLYSMADLMVIGQFVGSIGTVGVSTGGEVADIMLPFAQAISIGGQIYIAQLVGAHDDERARKTIGTVFTLTAILAVGCTLIPIVCHNLILGLLNCPTEAWGQACDYLIITCLGIPFVYGYNTISGILRGMGEAKKPLLFVSIAATVNIFADIFFVVVLRMEAAGTAIATVLSQMGTFIAAGIYLYKRRSQFGLELSRKFFRIDTQALRVVLKLGIPQLIRSFCVNYSQLWVKANINSYGMVVSATYSVGNKIERFMTVFSSAIDHSAGSMMGQNLGARNTDRVKKTMYTALALNMVIATVVAIFFLAVPRSLYRAFTTDLEVIEFGVVFLRILALGIFVHCYGGTFKSITTGAGAYKLSFIVGILDGVTRIIVCLFFDKILHQGAQSYFWGAALCFLFPGIVSMIYFLSGKWKNKKLLSEE